MCICTYAYISLRTVHQTYSTYVCYIFLFVYHKKIWSFNLAYVVRDSGIFASFFKCQLISIARKWCKYSWHLQECFCFFVFHHMNMTNNINIETNTCLWEINRKLYEGLWIIVVRNIDKMSFVRIKSRCFLDKRLGHNISEFEQTSNREVFPSTHV